MIRQNGLQAEDICSVMFSTTADLGAEFPALAARQLGWLDVAMLCGHEIDVPGALGRCIRVLVHWNTDKPADEIVHVYLKEAARLRPDRSQLPPVDWQELDAWIAEHLDEAARPIRGVGGIGMQAHPHSERILEMPADFRRQEGRVRQKNRLLHPMADRHCLPGKPRIE